MIGKNKKLNFKERKARGFLTLEIILATSIITAFVLISMSVASKTIAFSKRSFHNTQATFLLEEGAEAVRILRDNGWNNISGLSAGSVYYPTFSGNTWTLSATPSQVENFTRTVIMTNVNRDANKDIAVSGTDDPGTKFFTVSVSWSESGQTLSKTLKFYISDIF